MPRATHCVQCGRPSTVNWCLDCTDDIMLTLKQSLDEAEAKRIEEAKARKVRFMRARVETRSVWGD